MNTTTTTGAPRCVLCGAEFDHGCNSAFCSLDCEEQAELTHERAHAGVSDPDTCDRGDGCPMMAVKP